jgi:hypothetical protein
MLTPRLAASPLRHPPRGLAFLGRPGESVKHAAKHIPFVANMTMPTKGWRRVEGTA